MEVGSLGRTYVAGRAGSALELIVDGDPVPRVNSARGPASKGL